MLNLPWDDSEFVKLYRPDGAYFPHLSWDGQALILQLWRILDRSGCMDLGPSGAKGLPKLLHHPESADRIAAALQELLDCSVATIRGNVLCVPCFLDSQSARQNDKLRQQASRARRRQDALSADEQPNETVTPDTKCHTMSRQVTRDEKRENRENISTVQSEPSQPDPKPQANASASAGFVLTAESQPEAPGSEKAPKSTRKPDPITNIALGLFAELQQARRRCNPNVPSTESKAKGATREIERCLREGITVEQLRHVIAVWEALVKAGKRLFEHFNSVTPFRASNVHAYIQMPLETAKAGRTDPRKSDADLAREADNRAYFAELRAGLKRDDVIDVPSVPNQPQLDERDF